MTKTQSRSIYGCPFEKSFFADEPEAGNDGNGCGATQDGTEKFNRFSPPDLSLEKREDGSGLITGRIAKDDLPFFADYFLKYGEHALVKKPLALKKLLKERLAKALEQYRPL